jgi:hypothetical protein
MRHPLEKFVLENAVLEHVHPLSLKKQVMTTTAFFDHTELIGQTLHSDIGRCGAAVNATKIQFLESMLQQGPSGIGANRLASMPAISNQNRKFGVAIDERHVLKADISDMPIRTMADRPYHAIIPVR